MADQVDVRCRTAADSIREEIDPADAEIDAALASVLEQVSVGEPEQRRVSSARRWTCAAAAVLVVCGALGLVALDRSHDDSPEPSQLGPIDTAPAPTTDPAVTDTATPDSQPADPSSTGPDSTAAPEALPMIERLAIGDQILLGAADDLTRLGFVVDADVSRSFDDGLDIISDLIVQNRPIDSLVIHLGTNGTLNEADVERLQSLVADLPSRVFLVTSATPSDWTAANNERLREVANMNDHVDVVPWAALAPACIGNCTYADDIHLDADGADLYADLINAVVADPNTVRADLERVRRSQAESLRQLDGFAGTATQLQLMPDGTRFETSADFTLLASGSIWVDTGNDTWGSHDADTGISRAAFRDPDGTLRYQEIGGQDGSLPLNILVGHDPTRLVETSPGPGHVAVAESTLDGRRSWTITRLDRFVFDGDEQFQLERRLIDLDTGLVIAVETIISDTSGVADRSTLARTTPTDRLPDAFPGTIPDGAPVDRSGRAMTDRADASLIDVVAAFGNAVPAPRWADEATITIQRIPFASETATAPDRESLTITYLRREGFTETRVAVTTTRLTDEPSDLLDGLTIVDGWLCRDAIDDGICDPTDDDPDSAVLIESGTFAGKRADVSSETDIVGATVGIFDIIISAPDLGPPADELARFETVSG
ncbi:MAG: hypothetical protein AAF945_00895 [Actinomycetota bacterium]